MTSTSSQAFCTRAPASVVATASMVVIARLPTVPTARTQDRTGLPSRCTVQAPHWAMPQPYLVPVMPNTSRSTQSSGMSSGASKLLSSPLILSVGITTLRSFRAQPPTGRCGTLVLHGQINAGPPDHLRPHLLSAGALLAGVASVFKHYASRDLPCRIVQIGIRSGAYSFPIHGVPQ